jgi:cob(I)alamin adenosyltransferase
MSRLPRILIFTGEGKGKTTAALGMALRAAGHGMRTCIVQFIKDDASVGEVAAIRDIAAIDIFQTGRGFLPAAGDAEIPVHRAAAEEGLRKVREVLANGQYSLVILDEVCIAIARDLLQEQEVIDVVRTARPETCVVLTGRYASAGLIAIADTVTEMRCVQHAFDKGIGAQKGVEW